MLPSYDNEIFAKIILPNIDTCLLLNRLSGLCHTVLRTLNFIERLFVLRFMTTNVRMKEANVASFEIPVRLLVFPLPSAADDEDIDFALYADRCFLDGGTPDRDTVGGGGEGEVREVSYSCYSEVVVSSEICKL